MKKLFVSMILMVIMGISMITGCDKSLNLLPEDIVSKALKANNPIIPYHVEYKVVMRDNNKIISDNNVKEWFKPKDNKRLEMADEKGKQVTVITLYNNEMVIYSVNEKKATISKNANFSEFMGKSQKDKVLDSLKIYKNTHKITMMGIEKINDMEAYHIVAIPKDDKTLLGKGELWIHKDSWFIVKSIEESGDTKVETLYSKIEMNSDLKDDVFMQKFPDDVKVETNEDLMKPLAEKEITIEK
ncbi:MAG TPA: hypothetical protein VIO64_00045 [Pseudobacteroides sp.]|uniref:LolA family protein n=1 Tax=Pseudobacteroides sp. TaxID=1968840 RepID=UPI002F933135